MDSNPFSLSLFSSKTQLFSYNNQLNIYLLLFHLLGYYGKLGMRTFHYKANPNFCPVVNIDKIWSLVSEETRTKYAAIKDKVKKN